MPKAAQFFPSEIELTNDNGIDLDVYQCQEDNIMFGATVIEAPPNPYGKSAESIIRSAAEGGLRNTPGSKLIFQKWLLLDGYKGMKYKIKVVPDQLGTFYLYSEIYYINGKKSLKKLIKYSRIY